MNDPRSSDPIRLLRRVRQFRDFRPDPVRDDALQAILEVARWTGSGMNRQPWELVVVRDRSTLEQLAQAAPTAKHLAKASVAIVIVMPGEDEAMDAFDEARLAERILIAATALGLGAGIGWVQGKGRAAVRKLLGIPEGRLVRTAISLGYPTEQALERKSERGQARKPLAEIVHEERY